MLPDHVDISYNCNQETNLDVFALYTNLNGTRQLIWSLNIVFFIILYYHSNDCYVDSYTNIHSVATFL